MYTLDELRAQNRDLTQLLDLLSVLVEHPQLQTNPYVCRLVTQFNEKVWMHLVFEDKTLYADLLGHADPEVVAVAARFRDSARELRHRFSQYAKHWCHTETADRNHEAFVAESREMFDLIRARIRSENEEIFPLVEKAVA